MFCDTVSILKNTTALQLQTVQTQGFVADSGTKSKRTVIIANAHPTVLIA